MLTLKFKVRESEDSDVEHEVSVEVPSFDEATDKQRRTMYAEGFPSVRIKVQGTLRRALGKKVRGEQLLAVAQKAFDACLNETPANFAAAPEVILDAKLLMLDPSVEADVARVELLRKSGAKVINFEPKVEDKVEDKKDDK